jgi:outer membrane protein TolC
MVMRLPRWRSSVLIWLALLSRLCVAQTSPPPQSSPLRLTLKEAVQLALKQNPQRIAAHILALESERDRQIARAPLLPQAGLVGNTSLNNYNLQSFEKSQPKTAGPYQYIEAGPGFSQTIFDMPQIRALQVGREGVKEARAEESVTREAVSLSVVSQYLLVLRAQATYEAAKARVALAERLFHQAEELQKTGVGLKIDTLRANVELQNEKQGLIDAETATRTTAYVLAELLDLPREQEPEVADHMEFFALPAYDRAAMLSEALASRPEMKSIASRQRIAELEHKAAAEQRLPQLDFSGFWYYQGEHFSEGLPAYTYALGLTLPLFTGGRIQAEAARTTLEQQRIDENRRQVEARIVREVKSALDELESARSSVEVANIGMTLANDEVAQAQRRFQAGVTTNIEVITAQDEFARASDNQIEALYRFNQSRANLARAMGNIEDTYSK